MKRLDISMLVLCGDSVLAGRDEGEAVREKIIRAVGSHDASVLLVADFGGVSLATASFLDEVTLKLRPILRKQFAYPVLANMAPRVAEEFEDLLGRAGEAFLVTELSDNGEITKPRISGRLDSKLRETLDAMATKSITNAVELFNEQTGPEKIGATAWNNRLNALAEKGLVQEIPAGREKRYRPIVEGI